MAITIDWGTRVIYVPQADLTSLGGGVYQLDVDAFRLDLKDLEDSEEGMAFPDTHNHNAEVTLAGSTFAQTVEIINGYTVEFEDTGTPYTVKCINANHNIGDVKVVNQVSLIIGNSGGLMVGQGAVDENIIANAVWEELLSGHTTAGSTGEALSRVKKAVAALMGLV